MLLTDQTRLLSSTDNQIDFGNPFEDGIGWPWQTLENVGTITTGTACGVAWSCHITNPNSIGNNYRFKLGSWYIYGTHTTVNTCAGTISGMCYMPNGTHPFIIEARRSATQTAGTLYRFQGGIFKLKDENTSGTCGSIPSGPAGTGTTGDFVTVNIPSRVTPCGSIVNTVVYVNAWGTRTWNGTVAETQFANIADAATLKGSVVLKINDAQVDWNDRCQDPLGTATAHAYYIGTLPLGGTQRVEIYKGTETCVFWSVYASPWLLPGTERTNWPVDFRFPPGSTFYAMFEPLHRANCSPPNATVAGTVNSTIGKKRCVTAVGTVTNYYSTVGTLLTSINTHNYTFEMIDPENVEWHVDGFGGCISHIAVDIR